MTLREILSSEFVPNNNAVLVVSPSSHLVSKPYRPNSAVDHSMAVFALLAFFALVAFVAWKNVTRRSNDLSPIESKEETSSKEDDWPTRVDVSQPKPASGIIWISSETDPLLPK